MILQALVCGFLINFTIGSEIKSKVPDRIGVHDFNFGPGKSTDDRIIHGEPANRGQFPYQVSLQIFLPDHGWKHYCAASICSENRLITAAHCVYGIHPRQILVVAGTIDLSVKTEGYNAKTFLIDELIVHPRYNQTSLENDIAVIKIAGILDFTCPASTSDINPISISLDDFKPGHKCNVAGWGYMFEKPGNYTDPWWTLSPNRLRWVEVPLVSHEECFNAYDEETNALLVANVNEWVPPPVTQKMICAGHVAGGRNTCSGDSGGGLACDGKLVGIVSWAVGCARPGLPTVFTRVSTFTPWLTFNGCSLWQEEYDPLPSNAGPYPSPKP